MKLLIFAGTKNGRELAVDLAEDGHKIIVSCASYYGSQLIDKSKNIEVEYGKKSLEDLINMISNIRPDVIIDSTHPYAVEISSNLLHACASAKLPLIRYERYETIYSDIGQQFHSMKEACHYLSNKEGDILFTTGINDIPQISQGIDPRRIHVRVIPVERSINVAKNCGLMMDQVIIKKPPFTKKENVNYIRDHGIKYLVTKDGGLEGNTPEKVAAAKEMGIEIIVIKRPVIDNEYKCFERDKLKQLMMELHHNKNIQKLTNLQ